MIELLAMPQDPPAAVTWAQTPQVGFPPDAVGRASEGSVTLSCQVTAEGHAEDCAVVREEPAGFGFARQVLDSAPHFRFNPSTATPPADQGTTTFTIRFRMAEDESTRSAPDAVQRAIYRISDFSYASGRCHRWIDARSREAFEGAVEHSIQDKRAGRSTMILSDYVRSNGYARGRETAEASPPTRTTCLQIMKHADDRYEEATPDIDAARTALNSITYPRDPAERAE